MAAWEPSVPPRVLRLHLARRGGGVVVTGFEIAMDDRTAVVELPESIAAPEISWPADASREAAQSAVVGELRQFLPVELQRMFTFADALVDVAQAPSDRAAVDEAAGVVLRGVVAATYSAVGLAPLVPAVKYFADQLEDHVVGEAIVKITPDGAVAHPVGEPGLLGRLREVVAGPKAESADEPEPQPLKPAKLKPPDSAEREPPEPEPPPPPPQRPPDPPGPGGWL